MQPDMQERIQLLKTPLVPPLLHPSQFFPLPASPHPSRLYYALLTTGSSAAGAPASHNAQAGVQRRLVHPSTSVPTSLGAVNVLYSKLATPGTRFE